MQGISTCLSSLAGSHVELEEVRAHRKHPWNELADCIAKHAVNTGGATGRVRWQPLHQLATNHADREWAWLQTAPETFKQTMPPMFENMVIQLGEVNTETELTLPKPEVTQKDLTAEFQICTINVLALDDKEAGYSGSRVVRIDSQMHQRKIAVVCMQEARTCQGQRVTDHYTVYSSGGTGKAGKQHLGCEIWLHKTMALLHDSTGKPIRVRDFKVATVWADERRLLLHLTGPCSLVIGAIHAPCVSEKHPIEEIRQWWTKMHSILRSLEGSYMFLGCDANAPLASESNEFFGQIGAEPANEQGYAFEQFLQNTGLSVPSTFPCHVGQHGTWKHPGGKLLRRDYVLVSCGLLQAVQDTAVLTDVDLGFSHVDHYPVRAALAFMTIGAVNSDAVKWDRDKLKDPTLCEKFRHEVADLPIPRWSVDVDTHNRYFNQNIMALAVKNFSADKTRKRDRPQLTEPTLNLIQFKRQVLQMVRKAEGAEYADLKHQLKEIERQLRGMIFQDQKQWYDNWLRHIDQHHRRHETAEVYKKLQRLGRKRKSNNVGPRPLPLLRKPDGSVVRSHLEMQQMWCEQFAAIEAGLKIDDEDLLDLHLDGPSIQEDHVELSLVPPLQQIQSIIASMRNGKVPGPNKMLVEILKAGGKEMAMQLQPLLAKTVLRTREPLEWKGGLLVPLFKGKGSPQCPQSYRSIFLSDSTAKIHHSWLRKSLERVWMKDPSAIQLGGRKGVGTDLAHHLVEAANAYARATCSSMSIMFLDLKAAFYSVLRQAIFEDGLHDGLLCLAMQRHGIQPEDWHEVRKQTELDCATRGLNKHAAVALQDMFSPTYFQMQALPQAVLTTKGTRPGDPVGDILFNMLFSIILTKAKEEFLKQTGFQWLGCPTPAQNFQQLPQMPDRAFLDLAYVDDAAFILLTPNPAEIIPTTQVMASIIHDTARLRGLDVNYEAGKTEVMFRIAGKGSKSVRSQLWHDMQGRIPVVTEHSTQLLQAVRQYKHLGTVVQEHAGHGKEVSMRVAAARRAKACCTGSSIPNAQFQ